MPKTIKVPNKLYSQWLINTNTGSFKYRAAQANRPTPPRKKWDYINV